MFRKFLSNSNYKLLMDSIDNGDNVSVFGLNTGEKLALLSDSAFLFYVVESIDNINSIADKLSGIGRNVGIITDSINPFSSEFTSFDNILKTLCKIKSGDIDTLVITPNVLVDKFPNPRNIEIINIAKGDNLEISALIKRLISLGYKRVDLVSGSGEFSVRGDIVDIYSINDNPIRVFVDYDEIESIKYYNPITMLTTEDVNSISIYSNNFLSITEKEIDEIYTKQKLSKDEEYDELIDFTKNSFKRMFFDENINAKIIDYVKDGIIAFDGSKVIYDKIISEINAYNNNLNNLSANLKKIVKDKKIDSREILSYDNKSLIAFHYINQDNRLFKPNKVFSIRTLPAINYLKYNDTLLLDITNYIKNGYTVILCAGNDENANKLSGILNSKLIHHYVFSRMGLCNKNSINILSREYPLNIILPDDKLAIISSTSLNGEKKKIIEVENSFFDGELPERGDFVVHNFHGVGKCLGVETLKISDAQRDYVLIEYKNGDKLYLPVENIDQISKYMGSDKTPALNKIGGVEFTKTKNRVKSAVKKIAFDLIALYKERMDMKGKLYPKDDEMQIDFEKSFGFDETVDQLKAIKDCKDDMESGKIMDRLVCGDVGYGKTEVALRIAFKTILSGKQVAFLCPTTILSEQHYNTAKARMANFGVKIECLNRLKSATQVEKIKRDFASGKIDLLCGTHKLLSKDIDYKNLGLLILDEEQKFGVADKEKIKNFKKQINVLTLSATPIPRTLNMSLIGVRDISVIETPPTQRIPTDVQIVEYSNDVLVNAINRELARNGQVLIIYNRVESIYKFAAYVKNLVPDVSLSVAHGQMEEKELENEIYNLYTQKTKILIATTLIENGVDLPSANTLIVINSDLLGLSQLYQLKGRIGRSDKSSYAYFTFDSKKMLTENAYKRLNAIKEFSGMGSGFKIAMRDLEIRGAGSLLGAEQSGHIEKIGYNLYVQLLNESVKELRGEKVKEDISVKVETNLSAYLSHNYISSSARRMSVYKDIANLQTLEEMLEFIKNTESVYGDMPEELINLCKIGLIKNNLARIGGNKVVIKDKISIYLNSKECLTESVFKTMEMYSDNINLNMISLPVIEITNIKRDEKLDFLINYLQLIDKN